MIDKSKNMIELYPLGKDKDIIYKALSGNKDLVALVLGENNLTDKFKDRFFNTLFVDTEQLTANTYITIDTEIVNAENRNTKCIAITMDIFTALSMIPLTLAEQNKYYSLNYFGNRVDICLDMIKRIISDLDIGIGATTLAPRNPVRIVQPTISHYGKRIVFYSYDF